jgi:hypothetical protein
VKKRGAGRKHGASKPHASPRATAKTAAPAGASASTADPLWKHNAHTWLMDMATMVLLALAFTLIAWWRLVKLSPGRRR